MSSLNFWLVRGNGGKSLGSAEDFKVDKRAEIALRIAILFSRTLFFMENILGLAIPVSIAFGRAILNMHVFFCHSSDDASVFLQGKVELHPHQAGHCSHRDFEQSTHL
jgi:hypothetical protein